MKNECGPSAESTTIPLSPLGLLLDYSRFDQHLEGSKRFWSAIVTKLTIATDHMSPNIIKLSGGASNSHREIVASSGLDEEPSYEYKLTGDTDSRTLYLRLMGERDLRGHKILISEVVLSGEEPKDLAEVLNLGASLLQAATQANVQAWDEHIIRTYTSDGQRHFAVGFNENHTLQATQIPNTEYYTRIVGQPQA